MNTSFATHGHRNARQALVYWENAAVNDAEWMKWEWRRRDGNGSWNMSVQEPNFNNAELEYRRIESPGDVTSLDHRMMVAGMIPISEMLEKNGLGRFGVHAAVVDLESFEAWLKMRYEEMLRSRLRLELDKQEKDEMFEWYFSYSAVLGEVLANFRAATGREP